VFDSNGLYHVYTEDGLYVDTLLSDAFRYGVERGGMYSFSGESWMGGHFRDLKSGKVYLTAGRAACNVYEVQGWEPGVVRKLDIPTPSLTASATGPANETAIALRGGVGASKVATFAPAPGGGPATDGSMTGWEAAPTLTFGLEGRSVEVRTLYDPDHIYLRWHIRTPDTFRPVDGGDLVRLFTHERGADAVSFYLQSDPEAAPGGDDGRPGDVRVVMAVVKEGKALRPAAVGMYTTWTGAGANPVTYASPTGKAVFAHVGSVERAKLGHEIDADGKGFVLAAGLPRTALGVKPPFGDGFRTAADFSATFGGRTAVWWVNAGGRNVSLTTDEPSEARLYPGAYAQARFEAMDRLPIRAWSVCGPWGGPDLKKRPDDPHPNDRGNAFTKAFFLSAKYPPDDDKVDAKAVFESALTEDVAGKRRALRWSLLTTPGAAIEPFESVQFGYATAWVYFPRDAEMTCELVGPDGGGSWVKVNGKALAEQPRYEGPGPAPVTEQKVAFKKGWNQMSFRGYALYSRVRFGLTLKAPEEVLWRVKTSPTAPE